MSPAISVQILDRFGNIVTTSGIPITLSLTPPEALGGTLTQNTVNGIATFPGLSISRVGTYILLAQSPQTATNQSNSFNITAGPPAHVSVSGSNPQSATILTPFPYPLQVTVTDAQGNPVTGATVTFAAPAGEPTATLSTTTAITDANGIAFIVATAGGQVGSYTVTGSVAGVAETATYTLTNVAGGVDTLTFVKPPVNTVAGAIIGGANGVSVILKDIGGNPLPGTTVTLHAQGGTGTLTGTLSAATGPDGVATFSDLSILTTGTYQLVAQALGLSAVSVTFQITAAQPATITVKSGDGQSVPVGGTFGPFSALVEDANHNPVPGISVTLTGPSSGPGFAGLVIGPLVLTTDSSGVITVPSASANNLTGLFSVTASITQSPTPATFTFTNLPATANLLTFAQQPTNAAAGQAISAKHGDRAASRSIRQPGSHTRNKH